MKKWGNLKPNNSPFSTLIQFFITSVFGPIFSKMVEAIFDIWFRFFNIIVLN